MVLRELFGSKPSIVLAQEQLGEVHRSSCFGSCTSLGSCISGQVPSCIQKARWVSVNLWQRRRHPFANQRSKILGSSGAGTSLGLRNIAVKSRRYRRLRINGGTG